MGEGRWQPVKAAISPRKSAGAMSQLLLEREEEAPPGGEPGAEGAGVEEAPEEQDGEQDQGVAEQDAGAFGGLLATAEDVEHGAAGDAGQVDKQGGGNFYQRGALWRREDWRGGR